MDLSDKLIALKEHTQYMINMLALGQTLMNIDHATITELFNDVQPAQLNSLTQAKKELTTLRAEHDTTLNNILNVLDTSAQMPCQCAECHKSYAEGSEAAFTEINTRTK